MRMYGKQLHDDTESIQVDETVRAYEFAGGQAGIGRALKFPVGDPTNPTLDTAANRANKLQGYDVNGAPALIDPVLEAGEHVVSTSPVAGALAQYDSQGVLGGTAKTVPNLDTLKTLNGSAGQIIYLAGRATAGDGGEGHFRWVSGDQSANVSTDTQSGIYVAPDSDSTGASGAWVRQYSGAIDVQWFAAVGNGVADDSSALSAAIEVANGAPVLVGRPYKIDTSIPLSVSLFLIGGGKGEIIGGTGIKVFDFVDGSEIENVYIDGIKFTTPHIFLHLDETHTSLTFGAIEIKDSVFDGAQNIIDFFQCENYTLKTFKFINNQVFRSSGTSLGFSRNSPTTPLIGSALIQGNIFAECYDNSVSLANEVAKNVIVSDNRFVNLKNDGTWGSAAIVEGKNCKIVNNIIDGYEHSRGFYISGEDTEISNNIVKSGDYTGTHSDGHYGIINKSTRTTISANRVDMSASTAGKISGIYLDLNLGSGESEESAAIISGNYILNALDVGIDQLDVGRLVIKGNQIVISDPSVSNYDGRRGTAIIMKNGSGGVVEGNYTQNYYSHINAYVNNPDGSSSALNVTGNTFRNIVERANILPWKAVQLSKLSQGAGSQPFDGVLIANNIFDTPGLSAQYIFSEDLDIENGYLRNVKLSGNVYPGRENTYRETYSSIWNLSEDGDSPIFTQSAVSTTQGLRSLRFAPNQIVHIEMRCFAKSGADEAEVIVNARVSVAEDGTHTLKSSTPTTIVDEIGLYQEPYATISSDRVFLYSGRSSTLALDWMVDFKIKTLATLL